MQRLLFPLLIAAVSFPAGAQQRDATPPDELSRAYTAPGQRGTNTVDFATSFEAPTYTVGDLNGQDGWFAQFGNWQVTANLPSEGSQNIDSVSDGLGDTIMLSADFLPGATDFQIACADIQVSGGGVTNDFIPQDPSAGFVSTRVRFEIGGGVSALEDTGGGLFIDTGATYPADTYFEACVSYDRMANTFDVYLDQMLIADDRPSFVGVSDIENVVALSLMEVTGSTFFVDNISVESSVDGLVAPPAPQFDAAIPTLGEFGIGLFSLLLLAGGFAFLRRM